MSWTFVTDVEAYANAAGTLLDADPARHTISLTVIETARVHRGEDEIFGWWTDEDGVVTGAVSHTPPFPVLLGVVPDEAIRPLVDRLRLAGRRLIGVNATPALAGQFAATWAAVAGGRAQLATALRLFRLGALRPPTAAGRPRAGTHADRELLIDWVKAFNAETGEPNPNVAAAVGYRLSFGGWTVWEDDAGDAVSVAGRGRPTRGVVRVGPVYTPPEHRRRGYAAAATAEASRLALAEGTSQVVLFTDLANPTSNAIYRRIGFEPMADRLVLRFVD
jgi:GNAT superfamily N-acetyltransferase